MGSVNMYDPTTGQLRRIVGDDNHLRDEMVAEYEPNSIASHAYSKDDQLIYNETLFTATKNIAVGDELSTEGISTWESKTWDGLKPLYGNRIWTDGNDVYYSDGSSKQYVLNQDTLTWETMTWNGLTNFSAINIWTDGTNTYFSNDSNQYVLNKATHTWEEKSWTGLTDFVGQYVWTDSGNIYYLEKTDWYVLDKNTGSWSAITWSAPTYFYGYHIWSDGENVYHSNNSEQYVLNKTTNKWTTKTWTGSLTSFDGNYVWEKDGSIYYSYGSNQYVFDKSLGEWVSTTWTGLNSFNGDAIWINKGTYYCSEGSNGQYVFVTSEGNIQPSLSITEQLANTSTADNFIGTRERWAALTPEEQAKYNTMDFLGDSSSGGGGLNPDIVAPTEYSPSLHSYVVGDQLIYDNKLYTVTNPIAVGDELSTAGGEPNTWAEKTWNGLSNFDGKYIWTDGENIYYSYGDHYVLDKTISAWVPKSWSGESIYSGEAIWTDGENCYYGCDFILDKATSTWIYRKWNGAWQEGWGNSVWTDGNNYYYSYGTYQYLLHPDTLNSEIFQWAGLSSIYGEQIWTDGDHIYYSNGADQYVLNGIAWEQKTWNGSNAIYGKYVWTDGTNIYYSYNGTNLILDKSTSTWSEKTWDGADNIDGSNIWTDGEDTYYSSSTVQCRLIKTGRNLQPSPTIVKQIESSGHTIVDEEGTELTQRSKLQFTGAIVTDDSTNDKTKVAVTPSSIGALATDGASTNTTVAFTSNDLAANTTAKTSDTTNQPSTVAKLGSGETLASMFGKISSMFASIRKLWNTVGSGSLASGKTLTGLMGNTAIPSSLGTTVTAALKSLSDGGTIQYADISTESGHPEYSRVYKIGKIVLFAFDNVTSSTIGTIPTGYRPYSPVRGEVRLSACFYNGSGSNCVAGFIQIKTSGSITLVSASSSSFYANGSGMWFTD